MSSCLTKKKIMLSYFLPPITNIYPARCVTLNEVGEMIKSEKWAQTTRSLRSLGKEIQADFKRRHLPFVTFSGTFRIRHSNHLVRHSGWLCFDFDHIGCETSIRQLQHQLVTDSQLDVRLAFRSPSGDGLKVVVDVASLKGLAQSEALSQAQIVEMHNAQYRQIAEYLHRQYHIAPDKTTDVARACFLCHDPEAYLYKSTDNRVQRTDDREQKLTPCSLFHVPYSLLPTPYSRIESAIQRIETLQIDITSRYYDWYRIGMALASHFGEAGRSYYHRISRFYPHYSPTETDHQYDRCLHYNNHRINLGTLFYLMKSKE